MITPETFRHQAVRDLAYSCFSEPLISDFTSIAGTDAPKHCAIELTEPRLDWLRQLDRAPKTLLEHIAQAQPKRLGFYHETLWHFFLEQDPVLELIATNLQVQDSGKTVGEFDVIYRDLESERTIHLELAYKFYLQASVQTEDHLARWLGPNVNDRLDLKLDHMLNHQCQLSNHVSSQAMLESMGIKQVEKEISLRGQLLFRQAAGEAQNLLPPLNQGLQQGQWLPLSQVLPILDRYDRWKTLTRLKWFSPIQPTVDDSVEASVFAAHLQEHFELRDSAMMICALDKNQSGQSFEALRFMVTADCWPDCRSYQE